jgi:hypothetical protein
MKPSRMHSVIWAKDLLVGNLCSTEDASLIACCCWSLRTGRNSRNHGNIGWNPMAVAQFVIKMVEDVLSLHGKKQNMRQVVKH